MADPLSLLRQYHSQKKLPVERDGDIIFGEFAWPKNVKTNYVIYGTGKEGSPKEYYTLECLLFLLKNEQLMHTAYVRRATAENIPVVHRPDRKDLLGYLSGESSSSSSIDKSAPLEMARQVKRPAEEPQRPGVIKKPRLENTSMEKVKDHLASRFSQSRGGDVMNKDIRSLSETMSREKIAAIRQKRIAMKRTTIKGGVEVPATVTTGTVPGADVPSILEFDVSRERQWRTRTAILQSNGKMFSKNILAIVQSVRARANDPRGSGGQGPPGMAKPSLPGGQLTKPTPSRPQHTPRPAGYSRYDQEKLARKEETGDFQIDTMRTYQGINLKNVAAETSTGKPNTVPPSSLVAHPPARPLPHPHNPPTRDVVPTSGSTGGSQKRASRTPIIIIPPVASSLITMYNARDILQDLKFVSTEQKRNEGMKRENELLLQRTKANGLTVPYRVIDNPSKLTNADWDRVVAVFAMGPTWQFKGWPWDGKPVEIFSKVRAFHIKYEETKLDENISKWAVTVINLPRMTRHWDRAKILKFWEILDNHMSKNKPHLRF
ncbi:unnamed protein product [Cyprideis torosa]|uniref:Uncharacterized protein n=1 Tax=Cyprideis torosa TaxID=163714 RepID=A0A7R8WAW7_9CRUS|nr:unnamed protein product [Cyprideis torosa]CAG0886289.1 unnamed protein product [Cyprideis torosa]